MAHIHNNLISLIGNTPLIEVGNIARELNLKARILVKVELFNPGGSIKDRAALSMIEDAERKGLLAPGALIIEPTSGNTGVGLAWIASLKGYKVVLTMPETMSIERQHLLRLHGAEVVLTPGNEGMEGSVRKAQCLQAEIAGAVMLKQFENDACVSVHEQTTGVEIWNDTDGKVDVVVAGVGTGGTLTGVARALKRLNPQIHIVAVEPKSSPVLSGGNSGAHAIQGIGAGFIPKIYDADLVDEVIQITDAEALEGVRELMTHEGVFAGISSGAAIKATMKISQRSNFQNATIVTILPDTGSRYISVLAEKEK